MVGLFCFVLALGTTVHWAGEPVYVAVPAGVEQAFTRAHVCVDRQAGAQPGHLFQPAARRAYRHPTADAGAVSVSCRSSTPCACGRALACWCRLVVSVLAGIGACALIGMASLDNDIADGSSVQH